MASSSRTQREVLDTSASAQRLFMESSTHQGASNQHTQDVQDLQYAQKNQDSQEDQEYRHAQESKPKDSQKEIRGPKGEIFESSDRDIEVEMNDSFAVSGRMQGQKDSSSAHGNAQKPELSPQELELKQLEQAWRSAPEGTSERRAAAAAYLQRRRRKSQRRHLV